MPKELVKLGDAEIQASLKNLPNWEIDNGMLQRRFTLPSFPATTSSRLEYFLQQDCGAFCHAFSGRNYDQGLRNGSESQRTLEHV